MTNRIKKIKEMAHHRNGVSGESFYIVKFVSAEGGDILIGVVFAEGKHVAVFDQSLIGEGEIRFGYNSFRGDVFEAELRAAIGAHEMKEYGRTEIGKVAG